jgi:FKBP-type peptidyl-prolyl cis-trans isomerase 2
MTSHAEDKSPVKDGEIVLLDYELWSETGGRTELVDTTKSDVAREANVPVPDGTTLEPRAHLVGGDDFPSGIEKSLVGAKVGEEFERDFAPAEAFGERDPKLIELFSMHEVSRLPEMRRDDAELNIGTVLTIGGRRGRVVSLTAARVRVDFNPPFSGRKVHAKFKVLERVVAPADQAKALIELGYGRSKEFEVEHADGVVTIHVPERSKFDFGWMAAKPRVIDRIRTHLHPKSIRVVEEYVTPTSAKDKAKDAAEPDKSSTAKSGGHAHAHPPKDETKAESEPASAAKSGGHSHAHAAKDEAAEAPDSEKASPAKSGGHGHAHPAKDEKPKATEE